MTDVLPAQPTAPRGSEKYLREVEGYAAALEEKVLTLFNAHHVIGYSLLAAVAGFCLGGLVFG